MVQRPDYDVLRHVDIPTLRHSWPDINVSGHTDVRRFDADRDMRRSDMDRNGWASSGSGTWLGKIHDILLKFECLLRCENDAMLG